jgi:hypothetical protein
MTNHARPANKRKPVHKIIPTIAIGINDTTKGTRNSASIPRTISPTTPIIPAMNTLSIPEIGLEPNVLKHYPIELKKTMKKKSKNEKISKSGIAEWNTTCA